MLAVHIVGGLLLAAGLFLFVASQWTGGKHSTDDAGLNAWKISISGPPGLILIVIGIAVYLFPFTPWWPGDDGPIALPATTTSTTTTTTTTILPPPTTSPGHGLPDNFPSVPAFDLVPEDYYWPAAPYDLRLAGPDDYACSETPTVLWTPGDDLYTDWYVAVDVYDFDVYLESVDWDSAFDEWALGYEFGIAYPGWCMWLDYDPALFYDIWVYAYSEFGWSDAAYFQLAP